MNIRVNIRGNDGVDSTLDATTIEDAEKLAKKARATSNHMVAITLDKERVKRWDRERVVGENRWRAVEVDTFETLGQISEVRKDGIFVHNGKYWNPNLNGWVRLRSSNGWSDLFARFESGRVIEIQNDDSEIDLHSYADDSPETWHPLDMGAIEMKEAFQHSKSMLRTNRPRHIIAKTSIVFGAAAMMLSLLLDWGFIVTGHVFTNWQLAIVSFGGLGCIAVASLSMRQN